tara:strand:- start:134 stop:583 length:450 start_codon:yes stop_codon:yes gene_type:complete
MTNIILVRGISGSGKTTLASQLCKGLGEGSEMVAADDFFMEGDEYHFNPSDLPKAHAWCLQQARGALESGVCVVVHNTFTQRWEMQPYIELAEELGVRMSVVSVYDGGCTDEELAERNSHGVPLDAIKGMRERFEVDWKSGNPVPPWMR